MTKCALKMLGTSRMGQERPASCRNLSLELDGLCGLQRLKMDPTEDVLHGRDRGARPAADQSCLVQDWGRDQGEFAGGHQQAPGLSRRGVLYGFHQECVKCRVKGVGSQCTSTAVVAS